MATYNYTLNELSALGITDITITYRSLAADTVSMRCPMATATALPVPWAEGDRIIIKDDRVDGTQQIPSYVNNRLFNGLVKSLIVGISSSEYAVNIELASAIDVLNSTIYAGGADYNQEFYIARAAGESTEGERITNCRTVCERCFDWADAAALDCSREVSFDATIMGIAGTGSQSCWSLTLSALRWVPDVCTAMRYSEDGDRLYFFASRTNDKVFLYMEEHIARIGGGGPVVATYRGVESVSLRPRHDLIPPVCAITGRLSLTLPKGAALNQPGAFIYYVRPADNIAINRENIRQEAAIQARGQVAQNQPWQIVRAKRAPLSISDAITGGVNTKEEDTRPKSEILAWWRCFGAMALLRKIGTSNLHFGKPQFEAVTVDDAYPPEDDMTGGSGTADGKTTWTDSTPSNYELPTNWSDLYLFWDGRFPASADDSKNLSGLKWCRGRMTQYVWITAVPNGVSLDELFEFFDGVRPFKNSNGNFIPARYTKLTVEGIWINKEKEKYQENTLAAPVEENDTEEGEDDEEGDGSSSAPELSVELDPDYGAALRCYYDATRKLYYDGTIVLTGVAGNPGIMVGTGINLVGLLPEWASMATPCNEVVYDPISKRATLTVGSRDLLSMDELVRRQEIGNLQAECRRNGATVTPVTSNEQQPDNPDSGDGGDDGNTPQPEEEDYNWISPNVSASHTADKKGKEIKAFEPYPEGNKWILNGGITQDGIEAQPKDITAYYKPGRSFFYVLNKDGTKLLLRWKDTPSWG